MFSLFLFTLLICYTSSKELLTNGNFDRYNIGWELDCPICNAETCERSFGQGNYLLITSPCHIKQCIQQGDGYLKMQLSSLDLNISFGQQPFIGSWSGDVYQGKVTCLDKPCCLVLTGSNITVIVDNISLDDGEEIEEERNEISSIFIFSFLGLILLCFFWFKCCLEPKEAKEAKKDTEMTTVNV